ncbi:terminase small subunit-like protein [Mycobacteroides abscessus]|uniref:terminase small subunit-like protein n=1 Tax=Mycobacteroides abscessus TaxID=36809 RepID=UPI002E80F02E|nr:hypothetical protein [Mycobacteroides abscessus]
MVTKKSSPSTKKLKRKPGRPSKYTEALAGKVCAQLAMGKSLRTVCSSPTMPSVVTVFAWMRKHPEFLKQYEQAKQESADAMADEILYIADTQQRGETRTVKADGSVEVKEEDMLGHRKLQIESRKWLIAKMKPKKYGNQIDITSDHKALPTPILGGLTTEDGDAIPGDNSDS